MTLVRKRYDEVEFPGLDFSGDDERVRSRTKQSFAKEADINNIMTRYHATGVMVDPASVNAGRFARYGDFSSGADFMSVQNRIAEAKEAFATLPSNLRNMFENDPAKLLDYVADPANKDEAIELGIMAPEEPSPVEPVSPPEEPVTPPEEPVTPPEEPA